mgnify:CR=1 FL=1
MEAGTNRFFVSKVYLLKEHRGRGLIASVVRFYERLGLDAEGIAAAVRAKLK